MKIMLYVLLFETYGPRLSTEQLADALDWKISYVRRMLGARTFPIKSYKDGGRWFVDARDVAEYLDGCRSHARSDAQRLR